MKPKLTMLHNGTKRFSIISYHRDQKRYDPTPYCEIEYLTEEGEEAVTFSACVKINLGKKKGKQMLKRVIEKQDSPIKILLQEYDKYNKKDKKENKPHIEYQFSEEITKLLDE